MRPSIVLSEVLKRPTSVLGSKFSRRADRSPPAIFCAVTSTASSGFILSLITCRAAKPISNKTMKPINRNTRPMRCVVLSKSANDCATTTLPIAEGSTCVTTLKS
ncbi:unannotated protein [freshwater metagenome]|uniref:Unannotated protein n=1 Tax=freshwater metagenome TaxID=449393 RepID=A0A6J7U166_9ZZZZ